MSGSPLGVPIDLEPLDAKYSDRQLLGSRQEGIPEENHLMSVGRAEPTLLTPAGLDGLNVDFVRAHPERRYWLLQLSCSFRWDPETPIVSAWIALRMAAVSAEAGPLTTSSMEPLSLDDPVTVSTDIEFGPSLSLKTPLIPIVSATAAVKRDKTQTWVENAVYVEAFGEGTSKPGWDFRRTIARDLRGTHRLHLVVAAPHDTSIVGDISAGLRVQHRQFGLLPYASERRNTPEERRLLFG